MAEEDWQYWREQFLSNHDHFNELSQVKYITLQQEVCQEVNEQIKPAKLEPILIFNESFAKRKKLTDHKKCRLKVSMRWPRYSKLKANVKVKKPLEQPLIFDSHSKVSDLYFMHVNEIYFNSEENDYLYKVLFNQKVYSQGKLESILIPSGHATLFEDSVKFSRVPINISPTRHALLFDKFEAIPTLNSIQGNSISFSRSADLAPSFSSILLLQDHHLQDVEVLAENPLPEPVIQEQSKPSLSPLKVRNIIPPSANTIKSINGTILVNRTALLHKDFNRWIECQKEAKVVERDFANDWAFISSSPNCALIHLSLFSSNCCHSLAIISQMYPVVLLIVCPQDPFETFLNDIVGKFTNIYPLHVESIIDALNSTLEDNDLTLEEEPTASLAVSSCSNEINPSIPPEQAITIKRTHPVLCK